MYQISVVNRTSCISEREVHRVVRAINRQIAEDFEPYWAFGGRLRVEGPIGKRSNLRQLDEMRGDAILYILESANSNDVLGYHDQNLAGIPYGFVYLDLCKLIGDDWSTTLSHEALELIGDPQVNLLVQGPDPNNARRTVYHFFEMCDAVQAQSYVIDGVSVSNFVLPHYFTPDEEPGRRNDFCGTDLQSFGVNPGGYIGYFDPAKGEDGQYFARDELARSRLAAKAPGLGRVKRRGNLVGMPSSDRRKAALKADAGPRVEAAGVSRDPIEHVVVLMLENRSFDHMLGALREGNPELDGVDPAKPGANRDAINGNVEYKQSPIAAQIVRNDFKVPHEFENVINQIRDDMGHFVDEYRRVNPKTPPSDAAQVMAYFKEGDLPALHTLAKEFTVCDRWFSSLPGPTWPNRFFVHSGTSLGDVLMPDGPFDTVRMFFGRYGQTTIYDELDKATVSWRIYHGGVPQSIVLNHLKREYFTDRYGDMDKFMSDCAGPAGAFPAYAFIEPRYFDGLGGKENDQHSPAGVFAGEELIAQVYNAIRVNQALWEHTLLIITYDEHGGFYDHVTPPATVAPDEHTDNFAFDQLGVRVPAVLVSPWVAKGAVDHTIYDHASVLRYACEKWRLDPLGRRTMTGPDAHPTGTFALVISEPSARSDTPLTIQAPALSSILARRQQEAKQPAFHGAQAALVSYAELMRQERERKSGREALARHVLAGDGEGKPVAVPIAERAREIETWLSAEKQGTHPHAAATPISVSADMRAVNPSNRVNGGARQRPPTEKRRTSAGKTSVR